MPVVMHFEHRISFASLGAAKVEAVEVVAKSAGARAACGTGRARKEADWACVVDSRCRWSRRDLD
jgi:hypothetical protein